jgi:hypothetical protein
VSAVPSAAGLGAARGGLRGRLGCGAAVSTG